MVSLSRSFNTNSGGATFFSESVNMDDREHLQPILDSYGTFKPLNTTHLFGLHWISTVLLTVLSITFAILRPNEKEICKEYFIIIYVHIGLWLFTLVLDQVAKCRHHDLRINGYLEFYRHTKVLSSLPLYIVSVWNVVILFIQALMQHLYGDDFLQKCLHGGTLSPINYICSLIVLEFGVITGVHASYISKVRKFNKVRPPPDVQREEWNACASPDTFTQSEVGYRQLGDKVYDFLEKQADLIRHLKEHNERLSEKLMVLSAQLQQTRANRNVN